MHCHATGMVIMVDGRCQRSNQRLDSSSHQHLREACKAYALKPFVTVILPQYGISLVVMVVISVDYL
ncbi:hypothetical protein VNO80_25495 [Phaseolus coccineus]|uniref:Uncharacterized protein n=1 Tax=Phaseolus coccineus TaxID=3886 RepID=A0AAN9LUC8_PHACN